ncbi:MAG: hypothetical protein ACRCV9_15380 [Burkholderiaceae bacterium]
MLFLAPTRSNALIRFVVMIACMLALPGCAMFENFQRGLAKDIQANAAKSGTLSADSSRVTINELNALTNAFADRYMTYMVDAAEAISKDNPNVQQRKMANDVRLVQVSAVYDIVTNADPYTQLLDLTLVVTLQSRQWIDEDQAEAQFGPRGRYLIDASRKAREDIWRIAARVMKPEQLETLDSMILDWRRRNRDVQMISYVRFDDFAASRDKSMIADVKSGGGLLAPVDEAKKAVDEVRLLAERAFYVGKRMPFLMQWQVRSTLDDTLTNSQVAQVTDSVPQMVKAIDRLPQDIARERQAVFADLRGTEPMLANLFAQYRTAIADTNALSRNVRGITGDADGLLKQVSTASAALNESMLTMDKVFMAPGRNAPKDPTAKPFDINEYTQSAIQFTAALREANQVMQQMGTLAQSPAFMKPVNAAAETGTRVMDAAFWRGLILIVVFFVMLTLYRYVTARLGVRSKPLA